MRIVFDEHCHHLLAVGIEGACDIGQERRVPALVLGHEVVIDPDARAVVDGAKVQNGVPAVR